MRMFRKNILWIAIGNRNGLLLISKNLFQKRLNWDFATAAPLMLLAAGATLISVYRLAAV